MGNRAVITTEEKRIGVYLHWNGGEDSVIAFLTYCKLQGFRTPEDDCYGWTYLCTVLGNFFGDGLSVGIDTYDRLDTDNGVYIIRDWEIVGRGFAHGKEQNNHDLYTMLKDINEKMPEHMRLKEDVFNPYKPMTIRLETLLHTISAIDDISIHAGNGEVLYNGLCGDFRATYDGAYKLLETAEVDRVRTYKNVIVILLA